MIASFTSVFVRHLRFGARCFLVTSLLFLGFSCATDKTEEAKEELITIVNNFRQFYATKEKFSIEEQSKPPLSFTQAVIATNAIFPNAMIDTSGATPSAVSPWGTNVSVNIGTAPGNKPTGDFFWVDRV